MRVILLCINYNSPQAVERLIASIAGPPEGCELEVYVLDNSRSVPLDASAAVFCTQSFSTTVVKTPLNLGYFGAAQWWLDQRGAAQPSDWIIVSNVDLQFDGAFFAALAAASGRTDAGVVAPSIVSEQSSRDQNPYLTRRPSVRVMRAYRLLYSVPRVYALYEKLSALKRWAGKVLPRGEAGSSGSQIYAPHGACVLFRKNYFQAGGDLRHPAFLYGEEIFVAETARLLGLGVRYVPELIVRHRHQTSTSLLSTRKRAEHLHAAYTAIIKKYFT